LGLAAARRTKLSAQLWFGITGSVGKSTTKEMLAHILEHATRWKVHKAKGSFNNAVGLSHTMLGATGRHQAVVLELGTNHPGEIRQLAAVARPNVAVITCAAASHLEAFGSIENVAREKAEILAFQTHEDTAVLNADSPYLELWRGRAKGTVMTFGVNAAADLRAVLVHVNGAGCAQFMVERGGVAVACGLRVPGVHQVSNGLAALAASVAGGIALEDAAAALSTFESVAHRFQVTPVRGMTLIDDTYNANPASFAAALETLKSLEAGRRFVVAGDMLELGENAEELHRELGRQIAGCNVSGLVTVGTLAAAAGEAALIRGLPRESWRHYATPEEAAATLRPLLAPGDAVLVKGSHGIHLDKCCELLKTSA
jgi:UDP-N-acetylmuramoyl-tripeptide--D-alanyl-D-alanine ligase